MYSNNSSDASASSGPPEPVPANRPGEQAELGWSLKRQRALDGCARLYYHLVYGSWNGWRAAPDEPAWRTYRLKHLVTLEQVVGIEVHERAREVVRSILERTGRPTHTVLYERCWAALGRLRDADIRAFLHRPKEHPLLLGVYYGWDRDWDSALREAGALLDRCLRTLLASPLLDELSRCPPGHVLLPNPFDQVPFVVDGEPAPLWAAPDLAHWRPAAAGTRHVLEITDWKTGRSDGAEDQLAVYAVFLRARLRVPFAEGRFAGRVVSLRDGTESRHEITRADLVAAAGRITDGIRAMRRFLSDPAGSAPLPRSAFPMVPPEHRWRCARCPFAQLCDSERAVSSDPLRCPSQQSSDEARAGTGGLDPLDTDDHRGDR